MKSCNSIIMLSILRFGGILFFCFGLVSCSMHRQSVKSHPQKVSSNFAGGWEMKESIGVESQGLNGTYKIVPKYNEYRDSLYFSFFNSSFYCAGNKSDTTYTIKLEVTDPRHIEATLYHNSGIKYSEKLELGIRRVGKTNFQFVIHCFEKKKVQFLIRSRTNLYTWIKILQNNNLEVSHSLWGYIFLTILPLGPFCDTCYYEFQRIKPN